MTQPVWRAIAASGLPTAVLVCVAPVALLGLRVAFTGRILFVFMIWNLILAFLPILAAMGARATLARREPVATALGIGFLGVWLALLPNAPYLVTDLIHLRERAPVPLWFDAAMLGAFATAGLVLLALAMHGAWQALEPRVGRTPALVGLLAVGPLVGFGMYLGRFLRWNSWDFLAQPAALFTDIGARFVDPFAHPRTWAVTLVGATLTWAAWAVLASASTAPRDRATAPPPGSPPP